jgi:Tol biopolymer transport system component
MKGDGSRPKNLTPSSPADDAEPSVSGNGDLVAFSSDRDGDFDVYTVRIGGGSAANLTADASQPDTEPAFSADGETIAFFSPRSGRYDGSKGPLGDDLWRYFGRATRRL